MDRRAFLTALAGTSLAAITPEAVLAASAAANPAWALAVGDIETDLAPRSLRLIHGRAPKGLAGTLYRNGPARFRRGTGTPAHWFDGDGLVRAFRIRDGRASLAGRFVDTFKRRQDQAFGALVSPGFAATAAKGATVRSADDSNAANTALLPIGGELLALWEQGSPIALDPDTLATKGPKTYAPDLAHMPFLAHPRIEPNGRVWNLGVAGKQAIVWTLNPDGSLLKTGMLPLPRASYIHDFTATARSLVIVLQPWIQDKRVMPFAASMSWRPELGTQVLVVDKDDFSKRRIFDLPAFFAFHLGDAWEEADGTIRFDACTEADASFAARGGSQITALKMPETQVTRLSFITLGADGKGRIEVTALPAEFPKTDPRFAGSGRMKTVVNTVGGGPAKPFLQGVAVSDWKTGKADVFDFGPDHCAEEFVFVARPGSSRELDGWLVGTTLNLKARATELHVFEASRVSAGPVCSWRADVPLPVGFHGCWV
ncbi:carotenoid oxygenase family protein [Caulobacter sp. NIBR1757]|uniref:carotenoid oxygenase family protein n=1 Tax=Caulobacter sp. NIBR1757 TaxID=3016000 RepID=UPI0022F0C688|nr:carotenoid oxygenase family protein [Caulobacter sp. NIBR1757]WGM41044.1 Apocarotenoid-15,15'-oxygenase [Caulobacter sp. NIBR1757]